MPAKPVIFIRGLWLPYELLSLVVVLASDRIANVTGSDFTIDGGLVATL
jgi:NAD(P)-dependent dehydrogenase (short-subunit alcohol dehydrogenase family)